jgi:hypothetical protein
MTPRDITKLNRDIRKRPLSKKTPIDSYSKLKARIIKN